MLILILLNIAIIIYIYLKYYHFEENLKISKEEIEKLNPSIIGYINDNTVYNNYDLILAEILELNSKGYITIEYIEQDISKYNYIIKQNLEKDTTTLNKYELTIMSYLFKEKTEITRNELEEKAKTTFDLYDIEYNQFQEQLENELVKQNFIDETKRKNLKKLSKKYIKASIILIILIFIISMITKSNSAYIPIYIFEKLISSMMLLHAKNYTDKGIALKNAIIEYKQELEKEEFLVDKKVMNEVIKERRFINSIALHIKTEAKKAFINDQMLEDSTKMLKKFSIIAVITTIICFTIIVTIITISKNIKISSGGYFWIFTILAIIIAAVTDVIHALAVSPRRNTQIK